MVNFRELRLGNIDNMFEIISEPDVANNFIFTRFPFSRYNLEDFIKGSWGDRANKIYGKIGVLQEPVFTKHMIIDGEYEDLNLY